MTEPLLTERTKLKRIPDRGTHDRETIHQILDQGFVCHVGFVVDGQPFVIPTGYGRIGDHLYIHGSAASRMLKSLQKGIDVCVTVTLVDGLVLARSAFHHSMNYRSVVVLGKATLVGDPKEKLTALRAIAENIVRGRWNDVRHPNEQELKATNVLKLPIQEASAKIRTGGPKDEEEDYSLPVWAGVLPLQLTPGEPQVDSKMSVEAAVPTYVKNYTRPK
jgi:nitroimidazol reductase NimA-like FMN-containing flavoprotein (pyridoxamine 5'-phosphate oxidase superfamily)